jgi:hypothetical protein
VDGRPVRVVADGTQVTVTAPGVRTLFALRGHWPAVAGPLRAAFGRAGLRLLVRVGWLGKVELLPNPGLLARVVLPRTH